MFSIQPPEPSRKQGIRSDYAYVLPPTDAETEKAVLRKRLLEMIILQESLRRQKPR